MDSGYWIVDRTPGLSVRLKLTLSYAGFLMLAGALLLAAVWVFMLRYVPDAAGDFAPNRIIIRGDALVALRLLFGAFREAAAIALAFLLVFGLVGGWLLAGRMLAPLTRITYDVPPGGVTQCAEDAVVVDGDLH